MRHEHSNIRRPFIVGHATLGAGALLQGCRSASPQPAASAAPPHRIDVHHHVGPPTYVAALADKGVQQRPVIEWTPAKSLEDMDKGGVATAVASITTPGFSFVDAATARRLARECNEYSTRLGRDYPGRLACSRPFPCPASTAPSARSRSRSATSKPTASASSRATVTSGSAAP